MNQSPVTSTPQGPPQAFNVDTDEWGDAPPATTSVWLFADHMGTVGVGDSQIEWTHKSRNRVVSMTNGTRIVGGDLPDLPTAWATFDLEVHWVNLSSETGDVSLSMRTRHQGQGDTLNSPVVRESKVVEAGGDGEYMVTPLGAGLVNVPGQKCNINVMRAAESMVGDIGIIAVVARPAA